MGSCRRVYWDNNHQEGREAGGDVVGDVVDMSRPTTEVTIAVCLIANHGVEGVHHLVGQHAGRTEQGEPEEGGNDAVAQILSQRLKGCRSHLLGRKL